MTVRRPSPPRSAAARIQRSIPRRQALRRRFSGLRGRSHGFRLVDSRASYGFGLETFALGFPIHFDWSWRTLFNKDWEDYVFSYQGASEGTTGSQWLRKAKFSVWIGYDF